MARSADTRLDIQALRALAALGVVLFHLWPDRLVGGYAGVDVFFVISGFLITGGLLRGDVAAPRRFLARFWARRARRLLPAALLVIVVTLVGVQILAPTSIRASWAVEAATSTLYVENWALAIQAVDYWSAGAAASPFQHYWSLSVEEQFYLIWPLLLLVALRFGSRRVATVVIGAVGVVSFVYALSHPWSGLFFDTFARSWEFAIGAALAALPTWRLGRAAVGVAVGGWLAILVTFTLLPSTAGVPGAAALLPVLGTAAVILAARPVSSRILTRLGDISYPVYLWHWPLVVLVPFAIGAPLGIVAKAAILVSTIGLAALTHRFVEQPLRVRTRAALTTSAAGMAVVLAISAATAYVADREIRADEIAIEQRLQSDPECFGAAAVVNGCDDEEGTVLPSLAHWQEDIPQSPACYSQSAEAPTVSCTFGEGSIRVAVVGNSHGELLVEGFRDLVDDYDWTLDTYVGRGGPFRWGNGVPDTVIRDSLAEGDYDLVIVSYNRADENYYLSAEDDPRTPVLESAMTAVLELGVPVVVLGDNPTVPESARECVASGTDPRSCWFSAEEGFRYHDPLRSAATQSGAALIEFDDLYCHDGRCPMVLGDVLVYRDENHLTATFMRTLAPYIMSAAMTAAGI